MILLLWLSQTLFFAEMLQLSPPSRDGWLVVIVLSFMSLIVGQIQKRWTKNSM
nr:hypothetical protein [Fodinibius salinus]